MQKEISYNLSSIFRCVLLEDFSDIVCCSAGNGRLSLCELGNSGYLRTGVIRFEDNSYKMLSIMPRA